MLLTFQPTLGNGCYWLSHRVDEDEEIIVKAMTDYWVVGKKSDQRELYVILNQKNANLIEVNGKSYSSRNSICNL